MYVLYSFGSAIEYFYFEVFSSLSSYYYVMLYVGALIISSAPDLAKHKNNPAFNSLGASGAVSAVVFASILFNPLANIYLFALIPIPGILLGIVYLVYTHQMTKKSNDHINHSAHLFGAVFGILFTVVLKPVVFLNFLNQLLP